VGRENKKQLKHRHREPSRQGDAPRTQTAQFTVMGDAMRSFSNEAIAGENISPKSEVTSLLVAQ
jgi:hypothetical protein